MTRPWIRPRRHTAEDSRRRALADLRARVARLTRDVRDLQRAVGQR